METPDYIFILVEPAVAENVGSCARALKTMGFGSLAVINSQVHLRPEARWLAHGSGDILDDISVFGSLAEALMDVDLVIGTTAKKRRVHSDYYPVTEIPELIRRKTRMLKRVAIVFGREESGLTNDELNLCHVFTGIPMHVSYPSLNLAQAVLVYAWELFRSRIYVPGDEDGANSPVDFKLRHLRKSVERLLIRVGFNNQDPLYHRVMERFEALGDKDAGLLLSICSKIEESFDTKSINP